MRKSKTLILAAIQELINGYKKDSLSHSINGCPLCLVYYNHHKKINDNRCCGTCINTIFENESSDEYGCCARGKTYPNLNIDYDTWRERLSNNKHLAFYWQEVYDLLEKSSLSEVVKPTPEIIEKIKGIARLSNNIQLNITE